MTEKNDDVWEECNCMNCRLARIEDSINKLLNIIDNLPTSQGHKPV